MTPRSPKSPARRARVWKAWAAPCPSCGPSPIDSLVCGGIFQTRKIAVRHRPTVKPVRVEIREILPAPVPPRSRKSKGGGK